MVATIFSVAAMVITLGMVNGFQQAVAEKVNSFWGHVRVQQISPLRSLVAEETAFARNDTADLQIAAMPELMRYHTYAIKSVVVKSRDNFEGVLLKGVDSSFYKPAFAQFVKSGALPDFGDSAYSKQIMLSEAAASQLRAAVGDTLAVYFIRGANDIRSRPLVVGGIYKTGIEEYDKNFAIADIRFLRKLNLWPDELIGGYEIWIKDPGKAELLAAELNLLLPQGLQSAAIRRIYPNIFDWLAVQDQTKTIVTIIMLIVAVINLVTCLLVLVMERTRMVGVLKALGLTGTGIQRIFWFYAAWISIVGIGAGLAVGLGVLWFQQATGFLKMDEATYYVAVVPVKIIWWQVIAVASGSFLICFLALRIPLIYIRFVSPVKAIRFQ